MDIIDELLNEEGRLSAEIESISQEFLLLEQLYHWKMNFETGFKHLQRLAKKVQRSKAKDRKTILKLHRDVRLYFHSLLQIPYIILDHFKKDKLPTSKPSLEVIKNKFESNDDVRLLFLIRNKVVHEILLDEYVTVVKPVSGKKYLEITLPSHTLQVLTQKNKKGKSILGSSLEYFVKTFFGNEKGFIYLFSGYQKEFNKFEKEFSDEFKKLFASEYKKRHQLILKRAHVRRKMKKNGLIFMSES